MVKKIAKFLKNILINKKYKLVSIVTVIIVILLWIIGDKLKWYNQVFLPSPSTVWSAFTEVLTDGYKGQTLFFHVLSSMKRLFTALFLAFIIAVPVGLACGSSKFLLAILDPFIEFYRPLPPLAYYTLLVLWFGIEDFSKVTLLFLSAFAPLFIATVFSVQKVPKDRINGAKSLGASKLRLFIYVIFPSCLPDLLTGLRTSVGVAYSTLVAAEMVAAISGIGWLVLDASKYLRYDMVYMGIIIMGIIAIIIDSCIRYVLKITSPWIEEKNN